MGLQPARNSGLNTDPSHCSGCVLWPPFVFVLFLPFLFGLLTDITPLAPQSNGRVQFGQLEPRTPARQNDALIRSRECFPVTFSAVSKVDVENREHSVQSSFPLLHSEKETGHSFPGPCMCAIKCKALHRRCCLENRAPLVAVGFPG